MVLNACMIVIEHVHIIYIQYIFTYNIYIYIYNYICIYITHLPKSETVRIHPPLTAPYEAPVNRMVCQFNQMPRMKLWYLCVETVVSEANKNTCIYCKFIYIYTYMHCSFINLIPYEMRDRPRCICTLQSNPSLTSQSDVRRFAASFRENNRSRWCSWGVDVVFVCLEVSCFWQ